MRQIKKPKHFSLIFLLFHVAFFFLLFNMEAQVGKSLFFWHFISKALVYAVSLVHPDNL